MSKLHSGAFGYQAKREGQRMVGYTWLIDVIGFQGRVPSVAKQCHLWVDKEPNQTAGLICPRFILHLWFRTIQRGKSFSAKCSKWKVHNFGHGFLFCPADKK